MDNTIEFKRKIVKQFLALKEQRIAVLSNAQKKQLDAVNIDDIDFADPFEGTKSMLMDEVSQQSSTIDFLIAESVILNSIRTDEVHPFVTIGSLVRINDVYYLVGAAEEQFSFEGREYIGISTSSPFFQKMKNLTTNAEFQLVGITYKIDTIF